MTTSCLLSRRLSSVPQGRGEVVSAGEVAQEASRHCGAQPVAQNGVPGSWRGTVGRSVRQPYMTYKEAEEKGILAKVNP